MVNWYTKVIGGQKYIHDRRKKNKNELYTKCVLLYGAV
jgi:hypothetical protein